jgi:hypothetical protein
MRCKHCSVMREQPCVAAYNQPNSGSTGAHMLCVQSLLAPYRTHNYRNCTLTAA